MKALLLALNIFLTLAACKDDDNMPADTDPFLIESGDAPLNVAHRGGRNLFPENTIVAFDGAVALSVDALELDVCLTKDSVLVAIHDLTIDRTSDSSGKVIDFTFQELQQFNFGYHFKKQDGSFPYRNDPVRIPRLEDILTRYPQMLMIIEMKDAGAAGKIAAEKLLALIQTPEQAKKIAAFSFDDDVMAHFIANNQKDVFTGASMLAALNFVTAVRENPDTIISVDADLFAFPLSALGIDLTDDVIIRAAHRNKVAIHYWTINDKEEMKRLIQKGADGIITDRPDLMKEALQESGF